MRPTHRHTFTGLAATVALLAAACTPLPPAVITPTATPAPAITATSAPVGCEEAVTVWPQLAEVQPPQVPPGGEVTVTGSGGYLRCADGAYNESAREFDLFFDGQPAGSLSCYVNRCEGKFVVPAGSAPGTHVLATEGGAEIALDVSAP